MVQLKIFHKKLFNIEIKYMKITLNIQSIEIAHIKIRFERKPYIFTTKNLLNTVSFKAIQIWTVFHILFLKIFFFTLSNKLCNKSEIKSHFFQAIAFVSVYSNILK